MVVAVLALAVAVANEGPSLAEAAKRERERRQARAGEPARTSTDADLPAGDAEPASPESPAQPDQARPSPPPAAEDRTGLPDDEAGRKRLEALWRARFAEAHANLRGAESRAFEERVGVAWKAGIPYQTVVREPVETEELKGARRALADLEEEFRRTGLPPGWSRD